MQQYSVVVVVVLFALSEKFPVLPPGIARSALPAGTRLPRTSRLEQFRATDRSVTDARRLTWTRGQRAQVNHKQTGARVSQLGGRLVHGHTRRIVAPLPIAYYEWTLSPPRLQRRYG